jgi:hypothetical protein
MIKKTQSIDEYRKKWGIPDWRNANAYPTSLTDALWRWEFLRRKDDYRNDWQKWFPITAGYYKNIRTSEEMRSAMILPSDLQIRIPKGKIPWHQVNDGNCGLDSKNPKFEAMMEGSLEKYALRGLINPAIPRPVDLAFLSRHRRNSIPFHIELRGGSIYSKLNVNKDHTAALQENCIAAIVDLKKSISSQLDKLSNILSRMQRERELHPEREFSEHLKLRSVYLRALDALAENAIYQEIGKILDPKSRRPRQRGEEIVKSALTLQDYLFCI